MEHKTRLGPVAIFLTIVAMVITTLALLTVATSNADRVMAGRFASITQTRYGLEADGEKFLAAVAAGDVSGIEGAAAGALADADEGTATGAAAAGVYSFVEEKDGYRLEIEAVSAAAGSVEINRWKLSRIWENEDPLENIWKGF